MNRKTAQSRKRGGKPLRCIMSRYNPTTPSENCLQRRYLTYAFNASIHESQTVIHEWVLTIDASVSWKSATTMDICQVLVGWPNSGPVTFGDQYAQLIDDQLSAGGIYILAIPGFVVFAQPLHMRLTSMARSCGSMWMNNELMIHMDATVAKTFLLNQFAHNQRKDFFVVLEISFWVVRKDSRRSISVLLLGIYIFLWFLCLR